MSRHNKNRGAKRRQPTREPGARFLLVCEGQTEQGYFQYLNSLYRQSGVSVKTMHDTSSPTQIVDRAIKYREGSYSAQGIDYDPDLDQVWAVFDWDGRTEEVRQAVQRAKNHHVHVALSNPCFDIWLIWHFEDFFKPGCLASSEANNTNQELKNIWSSYQKGKGNNWKELMPGREQAMQRADRADEIHHRCGRSFPEDRPSSQVVRLMEQMKLTALSPK